MESATNEINLTYKDIDGFCKCHFKHLLRVRLPETFEEYWDDTLTTNARTEHRKAVKKGYSVHMHNKVPHKDFVEIFESYGGDLKQGRPINKRYNSVKTSDWFDIGPTWPIDDYTPFTTIKGDDPDTVAGLHMFSVMDKDGKHVALLEMVAVGNLASAGVHSFMGHKEHLKNGVMKLLLIEIIKLCISKHVKHIFYGEIEFLEDNRKYFMRDLGFSKNG